MPHRTFSGRENRSFLIELYLWAIARLKGKVRALYGFPTKAEKSYQGTYEWTRKDYSLVCIPAREIHANFSVATNVDNTLWGRRDLSCSYCSKGRNLRKTSEIFVLDCRFKREHKSCS